MADDQPLGIEDFKRLPHSSSSNVARIEAEAKRLYEAANDHYVVIHRFADMQDFISTSGMTKCWDSLAAIKQIEAGLADVLDHFSNTVARQSLEFAYNQAKESLRKASIQVKRLAQYVER